MWYEVQGMEAWCNLCPRAHVSQVDGGSMKYRLRNVLTSKDDPTLVEVPDGAIITGVKRLCDSRNRDYYVVWFLDQEETYD